MALAPLSVRCIPARFRRVPIEPLHPWFRWLPNRCPRRCVNWTDLWPIGPSGSTRSCAAICAGRLTGSRVSRDAIRSCGRTGNWVCGLVPWREPYELRGSRTVLREPRGEIPRGYSPCHHRQRAPYQTGLGRTGAATASGADCAFGRRTEPGENKDGEYAERGSLRIPGV